MLIEQTYATRRRQLLSGKQVKLSPGLATLSAADVSLLSAVK